MKEEQLKEKIALELNMQFDEAVDLFSEETLNSMRMSKVLGGNSDTNVFICIDGKCKNCIQCESETTKKAECEGNGAFCVSIALPSIAKPSLISPTTKLL